MSDSKWSWYYSTISRNECEKVLVNQKDGTFLVRCSESSNDLVLSLCWWKQVHHYKIKRNEKGLYLDAADGIEQYFFNTIDKLISWYKVPGRGLKYTLEIPYVPDEDKGKSDSDESDEEDDNTGDSMTFFFKQQLETLYKSLRSDKELSSLLIDYVEKGVARDFQKTASGCTKPLSLQQLLVNAGKQLKSALVTYLKRLDLIRQLFDVGSNTQENGKFVAQDKNGYPEDLESLLKMMSECKNMVLSLEKKAFHVFQEYNLTAPVAKPNDLKSEEEYSLVTYETKSPVQKKSQMIPIKDTITRQFEVASGALKTKSYIFLDISSDKMYFVKSQEDELESCPCYSSDQVFQLVKSKNSRVKLNILMENQNSKSYYFDNYRTRELFCQTVQQMKIAHSKDPHSSKLSVFIGTWNMGDANVQDDLSPWLKCIGKGKKRPMELSHIASDVYAIGTQESAYHEKEWVTKILTELNKTFKTSFKTVTCTSLWGIRLAIFVKSELYNLISNIKLSSVKTGIANALGNKGAVGVSLHIGNTSFCFINCHLASGIEKLNRRNQDFNSILRGLNMGQGDTFDLTLAFHHLFWFGDLNYRINLDITEIIKSVMEEDWKNLMANDQLLLQIKRENVFYTFEEEELSFPPTYRYKRGDRSTYIWIKEKRTGNRTNVPSWCDRVLCKSYPELTSCNTAYGCPEEICSSDHSPVFATYDVDVLSQTLSPTNTEGIDGVQPKLVKMKLFSAEGKIRTSSSAKFFIEFHSNCFEKAYISKKNSMSNPEKKFESLFRKSAISGDAKSHSYPYWAMGDLPELVPVISDMNYLQDQHILIAVKGDDGHESYGECVYSLKQFLTGEIQEFESSITHLGENTGIIKIKLQMMLPSNYVFNPPLKKSKIYDLICTENDDNLSLGAAIKDPRKSKLIIPKSPTITSDEKMSFENPCMKYSNNGGKIVDAPQLPPKKKVLTPSLSADTAGTSFSLGRESSEQAIGHTKCTSTESLSDRPPVPLPRSKKKEKLSHKLLDWLTEIDHVTYFNHFVNNGYDDVDYFASLTENDLKGIGIENKLHRTNILQHAAKLKSTSLKGLTKV